MGKEGRVEKKITRGLGFKPDTYYILGKGPMLHTMEVAMLREVSLSVAIDRLGRLYNTHDCVWHAIDFVRFCSVNSSALQV